MPPLYPRAGDMVTTPSIEAQTGEPSRVTWQVQWVYPTYVLATRRETLEDGTLISLTYDHEIERGLWDLMVRGKEVYRGTHYDGERGML